MKILTKLHNRGYSAPWLSVLLYIFFIILIFIIIYFLLFNNQKVEFEDKEFVLNNDKLYCYQDEEIIWETESEWKVEDFKIGDVDNDGKLELVVLLWKKGYYGDDLPFWQDENIEDYGNHLFVYGLEKDVPKINWGSSTIPYEIKGFKIKDTDDDSKNDLVVKKKGDNVIMEWRAFGFREK